MTTSLVWLATSKAVLLLDSIGFVHWLPSLPLARKIAQKTLRISYSAFCKFPRRLERGLVAGAQTSLTTLELGLTINAFAQMQA